MANNLTGPFDAVAQISLQQFNGLLATLHASEDSPLKLLHSVTVRVGDRRPGPLEGLVGDFGDWVLAYRKAGGPAGLKSLRAHLTRIAPPGAGKAIEDLFSQLVQVGAPATPPGTVRGTVRLQLGAPTVSLSSGSTSEITLNVAIRAHYTPDAGTDAMPEPVHGLVEATFEVRLVESDSGRKLEIRPSSQDSKIRFTTAQGTNLSAADVERISAQVRKAVGESFTLLPVDLPPEFAFSGFKGLVGNTGPGIALPLQLSDAPPPPGGLLSVNNLFLGPAGFALAVGREFIAARFQATLDGLKQFEKDIPIAPVGLPLANYHVSVTDASLELNDGSFELTVRAKAIADALVPSFENIVVRQRLTLVMFLETLVIAAPDDELTFSGLPNFAIDEIRPEIEAERDRALPDAQDSLNEQLLSARIRFSDALRSFDPTASASFRAGHSEEPQASVSGAVAITPDGVIVRGDIRSTAARHAPFVHVAETDQGNAFTALESWIPGGSIDTFIWSWVEYPGHPPVVFDGVERALPPEGHRFVLPKPAGITDLSSICLRVIGSQTLPDGRVLRVTGGTTCQVPDFGEVLDAPSWLEPVTVPSWLPGSDAGTVLKDAIVAHVSLQADTPRKNQLTHNSLVHFADWRADDPLGGLGRALAQVRRKGFSLVVIAVLPAGAFDGRRREVEARLGSIGERFPVQVLLTEDNEGGWTRTFAVSKTPSTYLMNARREFAWKYEGAVDPGVLAAALDKHLVPAPAPRSRPLRLVVSPGDRAPDVAFEDDRGQGFALHRLRGREVLFNFWQPWSAPCIKELRRLQQVQQGAGGRAPLIVAFHGGKERRVLDEIRKQHQLSFVLVHDADQVIARQYGVRCWPTTVSVNADGLVNHVQLGVSPERGPAYGRQEAGS